MPALHAQRAEGKTNGGKALPLAMRALAYGQLARLTPPRATGLNIVAAVRCVAPWLECAEFTYTAELQAP
eukprot:6207061-Pleurochrysis_carterae.AAC.1